MFLWKWTINKKYTVYTPPKKIEQYSLYGMQEVQRKNTYFLLFFDAEDGGTWGGMGTASLRGLPRGRLSAWARLSVDVAPTPLEDGEGPWSEGSTVLSSDDILQTRQKKLKWLF